MVGPGRNDPCPCGSGEKFKRCCGSATTIPLAYSEADQASALAKLGGYAMRPDFDELRLVARVEFWGKRAGELPPGEIERFEQIEMVAINLNSFFMLEFRLHPDSKETLLDRFLARRARSLSGSERRFLEDLGKSHVAPYEVIAVEPGRGMRLSNLWVPGEIWVTERSASKTLKVWDLIAARVMLRPSGEYLLHGTTFPLPASSKKRVLERLEELHAERLRDEPALTPEGFLADLSPTYQTLWLESGPLREKPQLATLDGELIKPTTLRFRVDDLAELHTRLDREPETWSKTEEGWNFGIDRDGLVQAMASLRIDEGFLVVETMAAKHGEEVRRRLESAAGSFLTHVETKCSSIDEYLEEHRHVPTVAAKASSRRQRQLNFHVRDVLMRRWLDEKVPALDHKTPREAALDERYRPRLVQLLKEMENSEAWQPADEAAPYNFDRVWRALRLERPGGPSRAVRYFHLVSDMRHYLDEGGFKRGISRQARALALHLGRIVAAGAGAERKRTHRTNIECRRRPRHQPCIGQIMVRREEETDRILWMCAACEDNGSIHGWAGTPFDPAARTRDPATRGALTRSRLTIERSQLRALEKIERLSGSAIALVAQAEDVDGRVVLEGERSEFAELHDCIRTARAKMRASEAARTLASLDTIVSVATHD